MVSLGQAQPHPLVLLFLDPPFAALILPFLSSIPSQIKNSLLTATSSSFTASIQTLASVQTASLGTGAGAPQVPHHPTKEPMHFRWWVVGPLLLLRDLAVLHELHLNPAQLRKRAGNQW